MEGQDLNEDQGEAQNEDQGEPQHGAQYGDLNKESAEHFPVCTECGFTLGEYRTRGLLGCPHCYASFGEALQADLIWLHHALGLKESTPVPAQAMESPDRESLLRLRRALAEALKVENYGEAARLRLLIQNVDEGGKGGGGIGMV